MPSKIVVPTVTEQVGDARERLMNVGMKLFGEKGLDGTTTRELAREAKINVSLISYYFGSKLGLYRAIIEAHFERVRNVTEPILASLRDAKITRNSLENMLRSTVDGVIEQNLKFPQMKQITFREITSGMRYAGDLFKANVDPILEAFTKIFSRAQDEGVLRKDFHPRILLLMLVHTVDVYVLSSKHQQEFSGGCYHMPTDAGKLRDDVVRIVLEGTLHESIRA
jgi:TetR/AcrR family transcriptional regulator